MYLCSFKYFYSPLPIPAPLSTGSVWDSMNDLKLCFRVLTILAGMASLYPLPCFPVNKIHPGGMDGRSNYTPDFWQGWLHATSFLSITASPSHLTRL